MKDGIDDGLETGNRQARHKALDALSRLSVAPTSLLQFYSRGRVAIIGGNQALEFAPRLNGTLRPVVVLTEGTEEPGVATVALGGRKLEIKGHLGAFTVLLGERGKANRERLQADLILDLSPEPVLSMPLKPPGYFTASLEESSLQRVEQALLEMVGTFEKPRFFDYDPALCAHRYAGQIACTRCIDACPADAIRSISEAIEVDANRCQGGGICASVCPAGAIRYAYPSVTDNLERVRKLLSNYLDAGGQHPVVVLVTESDREAALEFPANHLPFAVEELASTGLEFWFSALCYGARRVVLTHREPLIERVATALDAQLHSAQSILHALGYPREAIARTAACELTADPAASMPAMKVATFAPTGEKRQIFFTALDRLVAQASRPRRLVQLEAGAGFGSASVDPSRCTLCYACVGACPGKALQTPQGQPGISFIEANCLQCGMCTRTCPEDAIAITPQLLLDRDKRRQPRLIHEEKPFHCISCGKAFATHSVINKMNHALHDHWMFQNPRAKQRLRMCEQCRVVDMAQDPEAMEVQMDPQLHH